MKQVVATALALLLLLFLLPLLLVRQDGPGTAQESAAPTGELPIDRTVVTPARSEDAAVTVRSR